MTNNKMIEALAKQMAWAGIAKYDASKDAEELWLNTLDCGQDYWLKIAAAVLELVTPERLVWTTYCDNTKSCSAPFAGGEYVLETCGPDGHFGLFPPHGLETDEPIAYCQFVAEGQRAAQDHADAAHWGNTPIGKLVGGE
jgi:hypothetical protein